jgi:hypothetical protein
MTDRFRRVPLAPEVDSFQTEISCYQRFVTGGNAENRAVVADSDDNPTALPTIRKP